jgi:hypothetical protein
MKRAVANQSDAGSEILRRPGFCRRHIRLFGVPQNRRLFSILLFFTIASPALACPMCKDSAVDTGQPNVTESSGLDFNKSIYVMLGGFATVVGFTGRVMYRAVKSSE